MKVTIIVHFMRASYNISNVELQGYSLLRLINDACSITMGLGYGDIGDIPIVECFIPRSEQTISINTEEEMQVCFDMYTALGEKTIHIKLNLLQATNMEPSKDNSKDANVNCDWSDNDSDGCHGTRYEFDVNDNDQERDNGDGLSDYDVDDNLNFKGLSDEENSDKTNFENIGDEMLEKYFQNNDQGLVELKEGQTFDNVNHFRKVVQEYSIQEDFPLNRIKNERTRVTIKCGRSVECPWRIHASPLGVDYVTYQIKSYNSNHTCKPFTCSSKEARSNWIADKLVDELEENKECSVSTLGLKLARKHGVKASIWQLYRARKKALDKLSGDHKASYAKLPNYIQVLIDRNPGIMVGLRCDGLDVSNLNTQAVFRRLFVSFPAQRVGFVDGCRPFIGIDGCFLKGPYGGQLLVAVALDANFGIFPLAFMFAEVESEDSWSYFLTLLNEHIRDNRCLTFMSDKQKGILKALKKILPSASNRYCARHKYNNFKAVYPGPKLRGLYWEAVKAANETEFKQIMDTIKSINEDVWKWLFQDEPKHWSIHAFDHHVKVDHVTNNMTESFNAWLDKSRHLPILSLLEYIRRKVMKRIHARFEKGVAWESEIPPMVRKKLNEARKKGRHIQGLSNGDEFEVYDNERTFLVSLNKKTCQCGLWQISGLPCKHAIACIHNKQVDSLHFMDPYFTKSSYLRTYSGKINTIGDPSTWPDVPHPTILPPMKKSDKPGRPIMNRRREADEAAKKRKRVIVIHCKFCHEPGHNQAGCPKKPENQGKQKRGRSRNTTV